MMENWTISSDNFILEENSRAESIFTVANGYVGLRGDMEETVSAPYSKRGTYINGFYERSTIPYGEVAYGYAKNTQTMLNVADTKQVRLTAGEEVFSPEDAEMTEYKRTLFMKEGYLYRGLVWKTKNNGRIRIESRRFVSMKRQYIAGVSYRVTAMDQDVDLFLSTGIDGSLKTGEKSDDPRIAGDLGDGDFRVGAVESRESEIGELLILSQATKNSGRMVVSLVLNDFFIGENETFHNEAEIRRGKKFGEEKIEEAFRCRLKKGETCTLHKYICYVTGTAGEAEKLFTDGAGYLKEAVSAGMEELLREQKAYYEEFWEKADVRILGDSRMTCSMRFNLFQLLQSVGKDKCSSIAAKGLSGGGYGGHYFWESEAYILPVFLHTVPEISRSLLEYRYRILDKAREQARLLGHEKGALYSWRSIDGEECSAFFLGGSSQYHINADVALGVVRYLDAVQDEEFFRKCAVEILLETARLWINVGHYNERREGAFCIDCVTGPDEYTAMVNNNYYTNIMARENLWNAVKYAEILKRDFPEDYRELCRKIKFEEEELSEFKRAADHMYLPYDETLKIHKQDDSFLDKKVWKLSEIPPENHPLLTHYHPLYIYRHQICKQADLLLAEYNLPQYFEREDKLRDFDYYEKITTHDSSLSASIFSIMAADNGDIKKAYQYFIQTVRTDLDDNQKNTKDGLHMANMAGAWLCIVNGFAGLKVKESVLSFDPLLPEEWDGYEFAVCYRGQGLHVTVRKDRVEYLPDKDAAGMQIIHRGKRMTLHQGMNQIKN